MPKQVIEGYTDNPHRVRKYTKILSARAEINVPRATPIKPYDRTSSVANAGFAIAAQMYAGPKPRYRASPCKMSCPGQ